MTRRHIFWLALSLLLAAAPAARPADSESIKEDLAVLKAVNLDTDTAALAALIKKRTASDETRSKVAELITRLGDEEFDEREKASKALVDLGPLARPQLKAALKAKDLETRKRARRALDRIGSAASDAAMLPAAARVLTARKAEGACELLLNFLPSIEETNTAEEVARSLSAVAVDKDGKPEPALVRALTDRFAVKRWAAGDALARAGGKGQRDAVHKLLDDADVGVRRRVALALIDVRDKEGVPALIKMLDGESADDADLAEEVLAAVAGEKSPEAPESSDDPRARTRYRQAWQAWWKDNAEKVDLSKVDFEAGGRNYTLVGYFSVGKGMRTGKLVELDKELRPKREIDVGAIYPYFAAKTRGDRVLLADYNSTQVSERDLKTGKVYWTRSMGTQARPVAAERLATGHTLIVVQSGVLEVNREGKDVRSVYRRPNLSMDIVTGGRHRDGTYTLLLQSGLVIRLDSDGKETKSYSIGGHVNFHAGMKCHYLPNGGVVIPDSARSRLREFDGAGKPLHDLAASMPSTVTKLPGGNYSYMSRSNYNLVEVTREGKQVSARSLMNLGGGLRNPLFADRR